VKQEALLIVDMSNDFVDDQGGLSVRKPAQVITSYIVEQANRFLQNGGVVAVCMDAHQPDDPHFTRWPVHNVVETWGSKLYGELQDWFEQHQHKPNVLYIPKENYNAFFHTDLEEQLRSRDIQKVHVVGVCTDICDFLTIAGADACGFETVIHRKGVATFTDQQELFLAHMKTCFHTEIV